MQWISHQMADLSVVTLYWGNKYTPDYVHRLYQAVSRNLTGV